MKLDEYLDEFEDLDAAERLEVLMDFGPALPPLKDEEVVLMDTGGCRVQECQTPVFLHVDVKKSTDTVHLAAHVPEKSPTVRGYLSMLVNGLQDESTSAILALPDNMPDRLGLKDALGMTRFRGFVGIIAYLKREIRRQLQAEIDGN